jgi:hypothetical protein
MTKNIASDAKFRNAKPSDKPRKIADRDGLYSSSCRAALSLGATTTASLARATRSPSAGTPTWARCRPGRAKRGQGPCSAGNQPGIGEAMDSKPCA